MRNDTPSASGRSRYWVAACVLISLVFIGSGFLFYRAETDHIRLEKYRELKAIVELKARRIGDWRKERLADAARSIRSPFFRAAVEAFCVNPENASLRRSLEQSLKAELDYAIHADALLITPEGRILLSATPRPDPIEPIEMGAAKESIKGGAPVLSGLYRSRSGKIYLDAVGPVLSKDGRSVALLVLRSDPEAFLYPLIRFWPIFRETAETLLVARDGNEVLFLNDLRHRANTALTLRYPLTDLEVPAVKAVLGTQGIYVGRDYRGVEVLADLRSVPDSPWFMVAKVDAQEIMAESRYRSAVIFVTVALLVFLAAAVTAWAYRYRRADLYKSLYRAEREKRESHELFRTILDSIGDGVITTDSLGRVRYMNPVAEGLTGWPEPEARDKDIHDVFSIVNEETRDQAANPVLRVLREGNIIGLANHTALIRRDGSEFPIADSGAPIRSGDGATMGAVLVFRDQTKERAAEKALRASEEKYRSFFTTSRDCVFMTSESGEWIDFNDTAMELFGYGSREELREVPIPRLYEDGEERERLNRLIMERGYVQDHPVRLKMRDGTAIDALITAATVTNGNRPTGTFIGTIRDVTRYKRSERLLRESERVNRATIDALPANLCVLDEKGTILNVNRAWRRFADENQPLPPEYCVGMNYLAVCDNAKGPNTEEAAPFAAGIRAVMRGDTDAFSLEYPCHSPEAVRWFLGRVTRFPDNGALRLLVTHQDTTPRKLAEERLRENKDRLDLALRSARMGAWHWDIVADKRYFDDQVCYLLGIDPETFTGTEEEFFGAVHPEDRDVVRSALKRTMDLDEPYEPDYRVTWPDGSIRYIAARGRLAHDATGKPLRIYGIIWDITSRKHVEEALKSSLREKEVLLREVHHRVKNNLQVMSSLLNMQSHRLRDPEDRESFRASMDRIRSMALVHDKLYLSRNLARIDFSDYARDLSRNLFLVYAHEQNKDIGIHIDMPPITFDIDTAIPLGLIVSELVSNSFKHAFPESEAGTIRVGLREEGGLMALTVSDTGIGFPEGLDFMNTPSMGMQLVVTLVEQLEGTIDIGRDKGTEFRITFQAAG